MTKFQFSRILATTALCLAAVGLSSCTTVIDTGSMLDNVGKEEPSRLLKEEKNKYVTWHQETPMVAWKKGDTYYVELPVLYTGWHSVPGLLGMEYKLAAEGAIFLSRS